MRHELMQVVVERTVVYAAIIAGGLLLHELAIRPVTTQLSGHFGLNFAIVEILLVLALIVAYQPLRQRAAEALRYLMGGRVAPMRDQTRRLAVQLSEHAAKPPEETIRWFAPRSAGIGTCARRTSGCSMRRASRSCTPVNHSNKAMRLRRAPSNFATIWSATISSPRPQRDAPDQQCWITCATTDATLAVVLRHQQVDGLLVVGRRHDHQHLSEEEANAAILLAEQLAVTLHVAMAQADRLAAERRALQGEKLAMLGLVASSIAHEVKNPLSSIKTIATVLAEDLGPDHPHAEDARLIRDEVDRLSATTARLLRFARPSQPDARATDVDP
jgi:C4-dicarboxylate-specific signal transduction histidine kinase